jgi:hypothetical protein
MTSCICESHYPASYQVQYSDPIMATRKLISTEDDWNLAGSTMVVTRTRGGRNGRPDMFRKDKCIIFVECDEEMVEVETLNTTKNDSEEEDEEELYTLDEDDGKKPASSCVILEAKALRELLEANCRCPECDGPVDAVFETI